MEVLRFEPNVPVAGLVMKYDEGRPVEGRFGDQVMLTLADGRVAYLPPVVGEKLAEIGIRRGMPFTLCKRQVTNGRTKSIQWTVEKDAPRPVARPAAADAREETVQKNGASKDEAHGIKNGRVAPPAPVSPWAGHLVEQVNTLSDVFAACIQHASERHGNAIKPEDVRNFVVTCFINATKGGTR